MTISEVKLASSTPFVKIAVLTISIVLIGFVMNNYFAFSTSKKREFLYKWEWKECGGDNTSFFDTIGFDTAAAPNDTTAFIVHADMSVTLGRKLIGHITRLHRKLDTRMEIKLTTPENKEFEYIDYGDRQK